MTKKIGLRLPSCYFVINHSKYMFCTHMKSPCSPMACIPMGSKQNHASYMFNSTTYFELLLSTLSFMHVHLWNIMACSSMLLTENWLLRISCGAWQTLGINCLMMETLQKWVMWMSSKNLQKMRMEMLDICHNRGLISWSINKQRTCCCSNTDLFVKSLLSIQNLWWNEL